MKKLLLFLAFCSVSLAQAQYTAIPDVNFEKKLIYWNYDDVQDGKVLTANISSIIKLDIYSSNISDLTGIQDFKALLFLYCNDNQLTSIDISKNSALVNLYCQDNQLTSIDVSKNTALTELYCSGNKLTNLDISKNLKLSDLRCQSNVLTNLDVSQNTSLTFLSCGYNKINSLNVTKNKLLGSLNCNSNLLTNLDVTQNSVLYGLYCVNNLLTSIDVSQNLDLIYLDFRNNQLNSIDINKNIKLSNLLCNSNNLLESIYAKNGYKGLNISLGNPVLKYICIDEFNFDQVASYIGTANINSYCSFTPGGNYYTVQGEQKFDIDNNGCDSQDIKLPNLKFNISDGVNTGTFLANFSGTYNIPLQEGKYTITPIIENPAFFTASPASFTANFPTQTSPFVQDICITPNGIHHDVEVVIIPVSNAIPGFDSKYKLYYKNKGNLTESGQITLSFEDTLMDFVSASVTPLKVENGLLTFEYSNLKPFDSSTIDFKFILNKPTDTPALNAGMILSFLAIIDGNDLEETYEDNGSALRQIVVNSHDPNDKTCLEGNTVTPELVGQYVHYVVRFENTGTLEAKNIVVKDMIDTKKFDVNSLVVTNSSHSCVTKISETNKVEFIFENINLPFDNATNDGYIAFKIKTLPSLVVGDTFSNTADIFFDYNFPIITNEAKTTVQSPLNATDFAFENYFSLYPNPAKNNLTLNAKNSIEVKNINIFNTLGQLVLSIPNAQTVSNFDISRLNTGTYFVKIATNKGTSTTKFIKE